jgi:hypothetical protein
MRKGVSDPVLALILSVLLLSSLPRGSLAD